MLHGPFHRLESPTQTTADAILQVSSGEIWGKAAKIGGMFPCVKAYPSNLPSGNRGIEFTTTIAPDPWRSSPYESRWYHPHTPGVMLRKKSNTDYAAIPAVVVNLQP
jgi:hypothetical protein